MKVRKSRKLESFLSANLNKVIHFMYYDRADFTTDYHDIIITVLYIIVEIFIFDHHLLLGYIWAYFYLLAFLHSHYRRNPETYNLILN